MTQERFITSLPLKWKIKSNEVTHMMSKKAIKVICIVLAVLMILSCAAVLLQTFAADTNLVAKPITGDNDSDYILPIVVIGLAVVAIVGAIVIPRLKKKK